MGDSIGLLFMALMAMQPAPAAAAEQAAASQAPSGERIRCVIVPREAGEQSADTAMSTGCRRVLPTLPAPADLPVRATPSPAQLSSAAPLSAGAMR